MKAVVFAEFSAWLMFCRALASTPMSSSPMRFTRRARYSLLSPWPREALASTNALERAGRALRIARQAARRTAISLERAGLLRHVPHGGDRRLRLASLTPEGERSLQRLDSTMRRLLLEMTNNISPYRLAPLTEALTRLSERLQSCPSVVRASRRGPRSGGRPRKPVNQVDG